MHGIHKILILFTLGLPTAISPPPVTLEVWGFEVHRKIAEIAAYALPPELGAFYLRHQATLLEEVIKPDQRRYIDPEEAARHYIDLDQYPVEFRESGYRTWAEVDSMLGSGFTDQHGKVPWTIRLYEFKLEEAFRSKDRKLILSVSAALCHYIADAHVPLHTTSNYNGQFTEQYGIHGLWETRLPELFMRQYHLFTGRAEYLARTDTLVWQSILGAHEAVDSVLTFDQQLQEQWGTDIKYTFADGKRVVSENYATMYHDLLNGMVERQIRKSIRLTANTWYSCWVNAGMPDL